MRRSIRCLLGLAAAITAMVPVLVSAQPVPATETPDQVSARFIEAGYQVGAPTTWWTNGSTTFHVHDQITPADPNPRMIMVLVYPDLATAQAERAQAEAAGGSVALASAEFGPRLVPGYGPSVWQGNVAVVASSFIELNRLYEAQAETDLGTAIAVGRAQTDDPARRQWLSTTRVDADVVAALQQGGPAGNL
jgi:myo-inositol catabolism protein IolC